MKADSRAHAHSHAVSAADWGVLCLLSVTWGGSFFFYRVLAHSLPPFTVVLGRTAIAALALNLWLLVRGDRLPGAPRLWLQLAVIGLLNNALPFCCFAFAEAHITSGLASILNAATPVFSVLVGLVLRTGAPFTALRGLAILFGLLGVAVLIGPSALHGGSGLVSELACLAASISYAFGGFYSRRLSHLGPFKVAAGQSTAAALIMLPLAAAADRFWTLPMPSLPAWGALLGIGLMSTAFAYFLFFRLLERIDPTDLLLVTFLTPVSALLLGLAFLHEPVRPPAFAGMAMIGLSLVAIDGRIPARLAHAWRRAPVT